MPNRIFMAVMVTLLGVSFTASTQANTNPHLTMVPTDGIFHYQVRLSDLADQAITSEGLQAYTDMLTAPEGNNDSAALFLAQDLFARITADSNSHRSVLGLDTEGWLTLYHVGATFMLRWDISAPNAAQSWFEQEAAALGITPQTLPSSQGELFRIAHNDPAIGFSSYLWLSDNQAALAVSSDSVTSSDLQRRMTGQAVTPSLATNGSVAELARTLEVQNSHLGWLHLENLTRTLVSTTPTTLARELDLTTPDYSPQQAAACEAEWLELAQQSPRIVAGQTQFANNAGTINSSTRLIWELNNDGVRQNIGRLQGTLPNDLTDIDRTQFSLGLGFNVDSLAPVLMMWWQSLTQRDWGCPTLDELKQDLAQQNPAMIAMGAAMMQGTQSAVLDIFATGEAEGDLAALDMLLGVRSRDPYLLSAILTQTVPFLRGVVVPASGEPVSLPLPFPGLDLKARINGDYLAVYQGPQATARAAQLKDVPHSPAFIRASMDALQFAGALSSNLYDMIPRDSLDRASCDQLYETTDQLARYSLARGSVELATSSEGITARQHSRLRYNTAATALPAAGHYNLAILWDDCSWQDIGTDTLNADGSARYVELDFVQGKVCAVSETRYQWSLDDRTLVWANSESRYRDGCDDSFSAWEDDGEAIHCRVVRTHADGGFDCIANFEIPERFRYTPRRLED